MRRRKYDPIASDVIMRAEGSSDSREKDMRIVPRKAEIPKWTAPRAADAVPALSAKGSKANAAAQPIRNIAPMQVGVIGTRKVAMLCSKKKWETSIAIAPTKTRVTPIERVVSIPFISTILPLNHPPMAIARPKLAK